MTRKEYMRRYLHLWKKNNSDKVKTYRKKYKKKHRLDLNKKARIRAALNRAKETARATAYRNKNRAKVNRSRAVYRAKHLAKDAAAKRLWRKQNPDKARETWRKMRAKRANAKGSCSAKQARARIEFYGNKCAYCYGPFEQLDHVIPLSRGGSNWPANLRPSCRKCNNRKWAKSLKDFMKLVSMTFVVILTQSCFPKIEADCSTLGGLYVKGGDCASVYPVQQDIEREAEALGLGPHVLWNQLIWVRREPSGSFDGPSGKVAGLTYCESGMSIVVLDGEDWRHSAFVHEAFHLAQNCEYDDALFAECTRAGGEGCDFKAAHPRWTEEVYPAIARISNQ